ncbi:LacI family DNA-binding transcriptional regulator [Gelidibacter mesophilus]|uniref:LacI family DNA-binding transcriptional regulator n=1 Tax=Gelidibacter mesophilus TaxID=169050 RepID=UPI00041D0392|nr:LacI family DNA-binding transcriptional regulator [Gelidibacter mesophilus]
MIQTRTTLAEMSKALNLSISTVSKSLSGSPEISLPTQTRVRDFAKSCNYIPNNFASGLRKGYTNTIGLVIPNILNSFYAKVLAGIENHLDQNNYKLITSISNESIDKESKSLNKMAGGYVDGLIMCVSKETELTNTYDHIKALTGRGTPLVLFDRICEMIDCDKVIIDDYKSAYETTDYLIKHKGLKNIVMTSLINGLHHGKLRAEGFKDALKTNHLSTENKIIVADTPEALKIKLTAFLENDTTVDGVFGLNEQAIVQTIQVTNVLKSYSKHQDIVIAGFCNHYQANYHPDLIIVEQNAETIGAAAAKLIIKRIKSKEMQPFYTKMIATELV